jgi:replication initiation and membrane attachment protein DnaB
MNRGRSTRYNDARGKKSNLPTDRGAHAFLAAFDLIHSYYYQKNDSYYLCLHERDPLPST